MLYIEITHQAGGVETFGARGRDAEVLRIELDPFYDRFTESLSRTAAWLKRNEDYQTRNSMHNEASFAGL